MVNPSKVRRRTSDTPDAGLRHPGPIGALRIILPVVLTVALFMVSIFLVALPAVESSMMARKREMVRELTEVAWSAMATFEAEARSGALSQREAQAEAIAHVRELRYGPERKDYFWINDRQPRMLMHPYRPDLEGRDLTAEADVNGKRFFYEATRIAERQGSGFIDYMWQWKDDPSRIVPKTSYVKAFEPWGWVIGTGLYVEDVRDEIAAITRRLVWISLGVLGVVGVLSVYIVWGRLRSEKERRGAEQALVEGERKYRTLFEASADAVILFDGMVVVDCNQAALRVFGYDGDDELLHRHLVDLSPPTQPGGEDSANLVERHIAKATQGGSHQFEWVYIRSDGIPFPAEVSLAVTDLGDRKVLQSVVRDITERKQVEKERAALQDQLHQAQKMEAVGHLAAGVAHDFNNLLTAILAHVELAKGMLGNGPGPSESLGVIEQAANHATRLTKSLLTFSRRLPPERKPVDLSCLIAESGRFLRQMLPATIDLVVEDAWETPLWAHADGSQLQQIILNLAINARDAMPDGGTLRISIQPDQDSSDDRPDAVAEEAPTRARLVVSDTGTGMSPEVRSRAFDPFYTTKERGRGTGLGLSMVHGIVSDHGGRIELDSHVGEGSTFTIVLPCIRHPSLSEGAVAPQALPHGQGELILLAEDDRFVRETTAMMLRSLGYRVVQVKDGPTLLESFRQFRKAVGLAIIDVDLPGRDGRACLREIRACESEIPAIVITGRVDVDLPDDLAGSAILLRKPMRMVELASRVSEVLHHAMSQEIAV